MDFFLADLRMDLAWHGWYLGFFPPAHLQPDVCYFVRPTSWKIGFAVRQRPGHPSKSRTAAFFVYQKTKRNSSLFHLKPKLTRPSPRGPRGSLNSWLMQRVDRCQCAVLMHIAECTTPYTWSRPQTSLTTEVDSACMAAPIRRGQHVQHLWLVPSRSCQSHSSMSTERNAWRAS